MKKEKETERCGVCGLDFPVLPPVPENGGDPFQHVRDFDSLVAIRIVEKILADYLHPVPSRPTMVSMIKNGTFTGQQFGGNSAWYIRHSSLDSFLLKSQQKLAA